MNTPTKLIWHNRKQLEVPRSMRQNLFRQNLDKGMELDEAIKAATKQTGWCSQYDSFVAGKTRK